jgi:hypothetical protein
MNRFLLLFFTLCAFGLAACDGGAGLPPDGDCRLPERGGVYIQPTATPYADPLLTPAPTTTVTATPETTPTTSPTPRPYCTPTPTPAGQPGIPATPRPLGYGAGEVRNLTLSPDDATLLAAAVGRQTTAVAWRDERGLLVATGEGGSDFQAQVIGEGEQAVLAYSLTDRLHLVYVRDGQMYYRAADPGQHPAEVPETAVGSGHRPTLALDGQGWAHLLYLAGSGVYQRVQQATGWGEPVLVGLGESVDAHFTADGRLLAAVKQGEWARVYSLADSQSDWLEQAAFHAGETISGPPRLDSDGEWAYLAWITERLDPTGDGDWPNFRPEYKPAAPWANRIQAGTNAQQYFTRFAVHSAGVYQQVDVTGGQLTLTAWGQVWSSDEPCQPPDASCNPTEMRLQVGLDPTGGLNPASSQVVWSGAANPVDAYQPLSVSTAAAGPLATVYLKSNPLQPRSHNDVYWDSVTLSGGVLVNGGFETGFPEYNGIGELKVAEGWHPFYIEDGVTGVSEGWYTVYAAWSENGGQTWSEATVILHNQEGGRRSGKFSGAAYPIIALESEPGPTVNFLVVYEEGDPPPQQPDALRYGRPRLAVCPLGETKCSASPGLRLLPNQAARPTVHLAVAVSPERQRGALAWDAWQPGETAKDVYATALRLQALTRETP